MDYSSAVTELNERLNQLNLPALDGDGRCMIRGPQGNRFMLELAPEGEFFSFYAPLRQVKENGNRAALFEAALTMNLMPDFIGGASFAFDPRTSSIVLSQPIDLANLDTESLTMAMSAFSLASHMAQEALSGTPN
ncbi:Tir chaperone family protein CesT [Roseimicrobium gellanilyticum]|uniref:Tir chaperone family protein CesT n=1 Tax=Roseimicrobium gellanilyticum TaxID=748857 RepID=A0A366HSM0_9BACT|nr:CesT family type III secretion system chaperone [Roseimicrobium gellanilyticum]RBP45924.1 Tir chaperone family protein CesT [Roseimicrobium gellanilyticum]